MKAPHTLESSILEAVAGGWRHRHWHHRGGFRSSVIVNNYWGAQPAAPAQNTNSSFSFSVSSGFSF